MKTILILLVTLFMAVPLHATSYVPLAQGSAPLKEDEVLAVGARVQLFHSGTQDVKNAIKVNDLLTVYREFPTAGPGSARETGKVRVISVSDNYHLEGEVIEGHAGLGYLALKDGAACLITTRPKLKQ